MLRVLVRLLLSDLKYEAHSADVMMLCLVGTSATSDDCAHESLITDWLTHDLDKG